MSVRNGILGLAVALLAQLAPSLALAGNGCGCGYDAPASSCGCGSPHVTVVCGKHCGLRHHHRPQWNISQAPSGPLVSSTAAISTPIAYAASDYALVSAVRPVNLIQMAPQSMQSYAQTQESAALTNAQKIAELEQRLERLRSRVDVLQTSIDGQTELLHAISKKLDEKADRSDKAAEK